MSDIQWGDPPSAGTVRSGAVKTFVEQLKRRPGQWAKYPRPVAGASTVSINRKRFPGTDWTSRKRPDNRYDIYGMWVGES